MTGTESGLRSWWRQWREEWAERGVWDQAQTWEDVCELTAQFCEGKRILTPGHSGPRCPETVEIGAQLAHANRQGLLTSNSEPGRSVADHGFEQNAGVSGLADPDTVERLHRLVRGTRLAIRVTESGWETSGYDDPRNWDHTVLSVGIWDPQPGSSTLLWDRLGQRDWDNPAPLRPDERATEAELQVAEVARAPWRTLSGLSETPGVHRDWTPRGWLDLQKTHKTPCPGCGCTSQTNRPGCGCTRLDCGCEAETSAAKEPPMPEPDVKVHLSKGCELCGRTDEHAHTQADWRALIDSKGAAPAADNLPPAAEPHVPPPDTRRGQLRSLRQELLAAIKARTLDDTRETRARKDAVEAALAAALNPPPAPEQHVPPTRAANDADTVIDGTVQVIEDYQKAKQDLAESVLDAATAKNIFVRPTPSSTTISGGTVSHASEGNAQLAQALQDLEQAQGAIQQVVEQLTAAQQNVLGAADESQHSEADEAKGVLEQAKQAADELVQTVGAAQQAVEQVRL